MNDESKSRYELLSEVFPRMNYLPALYVPGSGPGLSCALAFGSMAERLIFIWSQTEE